MKRKEETAIILSALATAGVPESNQVKSAVDCGSKMIRVKQFAELLARNAQEPLEPAVSAVIQHKKETKA